MVPFSCSEPSFDVIEIVGVDGVALDFTDDGEEVVERGDGLEWPEVGIAECAAAGSDQKRSADVVDRHSFVEEIFRESPIGGSDAASCPGCSSVAFEDFADVPVFGGSAHAPLLVFDRGLKRSM
jgi:hypothetical protein